MATHATYETIDERPVVAFERRLAHPAQAVWDAITKPAELALWFPCAVEVDLRLGGRMRFVFDQMPLEGEPIELSGEVTELEPPTRFSFTWGGDHLHFAIDPIESDDACVLRFSVELDTSDKAARDAAGWHLCLDQLALLLDGTPVHRPYDPGAWRPRYEEYQRLGLPATAPIPD
jgi:uncharacterized protein YndB with AHSA1/START domain